MPSFSTRTAALRSLKDISIDAVQHAKELIVEKNGKFYFDEDAAEQFLNTQDDITNANLENNMTTEITLENFKTASTSDLVAFYNDHAESSVKKFRDRATAEKKVQIILEALAAEAPATVTETAPKMMSISDTVKFAKEIAANKGKKAPKSIMGEMMQTLAHDPKMTPPEVREVDPTTVITDDFATVTEAEHKQHRGEKDAIAAKAPSGDRTISNTQAETMKTTLKLDRTIVCGDQEWKNAFQMWKSNPTWMTSAQQDGLTAKLYKAAKNGQRITVEINGRFFHLKNV